MEQFKKTSPDPTLIDVMREAQQEELEGMRALAALAAEHKDQADAAREAGEEFAFYNEANGQKIPYRTPETWAKDIDYFEGASDDIIRTLDMAQTASEQRSGLLEVLRSIFNASLLEGVPVDAYGSVIELIAVAREKHEALHEQEKKQAGGFAQRMAQLQQGGGDVLREAHLYVDNAFMSYHALNEMLIAEQLKNGTSPERVYTNLYAYSSDQFLELYPERTGTPWQEGDDEEFHAIILEKITDLFKPYSHVLPYGPSPDMAGLLMQAVGVAVQDDIKAKRWSCVPAPSKLQEAAPAATNDAQVYQRRARRIRSAPEVELHREKRRFIDMVYDPEIIGRVDRQLTPLFMKYSDMGSETGEFIGALSEYKRHERPNGLRL